MESQTEYDLNQLIKLLQLSTPDSLNIASAILERNHELDIPELPQLRQAIYRSLSAKKERQLSQEVKGLKAKLIADLVQTSKVKGLGCVASTEEVVK